MGDFGIMDQLLGVTMGILGVTEKLLGVMVELLCITVGLFDITMKILGVMVGEDFGCNGETFVYNGGAFWYNVGGFECNDGAIGYNDAIFWCNGGRFQYNGEALIHIAMTLDANYLRGTMAAVFPILQHLTCSNNVEFHFLCAKYKPEVLPCYFNTGVMMVDIDKSRQIGPTVPAPPFHLTPTILLRSTVPPHSHHSK
ncbi:hypothetical protein DITRI_Ditri13aG0086300 [Diplodiscus trichospermus]